MKEVVIIITDTYFYEIVDSLTVKDFFLLSYLTENNATEKFKSIKRRRVAEDMLNSDARITEATLRKCLYRLEPMKFIEIVREEKEYKMFVTPRGIEALQIKLENEGE
ncbi:hypothetical protein [Niallia sp. FSL M8-0099]|uniref:hypothetical protein n=1 Tax=Niallia sp. FSL M8-0099 TaxID=2954519 RepID=UPI0030F52E68